MDGLRAYCQTIYEARFFLWHLVKLDLKNKFRRSKLGMLWTIMNPLLLSMLMGAVFGVAFHFNIREYMPYVLSGILFWDLVMGAFSAGAFSITAHDCFIRQCNYPLSLYTLKNALVTVISFSLAMVALAVWVALWKPENILWGIVTFLPTLIIYFFMVWGGTTIAGYTFVQYRDYPMMIALVLQAIWYVSPIFFDKSLFSMNEYLLTWFQINPITHMLNLMRAPLLDGSFPAAEDYLSSILLVVAIDLLAFYLNKKKARDVIFYL